ncbi:hypothetical protein Syun_002434 [Stephania yunnanensis]|uniref:RNA helicase n=1 Tax=Stephania yunnanensis TaxID=152371 RepID=A0AAP0LJP8_9MAGN
MSHRPNYQGGGRRGGAGGGRRGGGRGGGGRGGRGEQRWWDPAWRAERLRQMSAENPVEVLDENEWWGKMEQLKRGGEQELIIRRNFGREGQRVLDDFARRLGLHFFFCLKFYGIGILGEVELFLRTENDWAGNLEEILESGQVKPNSSLLVTFLVLYFWEGSHAYNKGRALVVSKSPLPDYRADLDERHGSTQTEIRMSTETEKKVGNLLASTVAAAPSKGSAGASSKDAKQALSANNVENSVPKMEVDLTKKSLNAELKDKQDEKKARDSLKAMQSFREKLPAFKMKTEFLKAVAENQVLVVSGETGCGKTTQLPQFILEEEIARLRGADCSIICTQPRRISAISVSARISSERGEDLGETVGYQIRLEAKRSAHTRLLFCTTGVLLRQLVDDPELTGVSHLLVDEIHERGMNEDFLLIILRDLLPRRPDLRVILMSATINAEMFSKYFGNAPTIHIPGLTFPVEELFLEDILEKSRYRIKSEDDGFQGNSRRRRPRDSKKDPLLESFEEIDINSHFKNYSASTRQSLETWSGTQVDLGLVEATIEYICCHEGEGAILVFLTGWDEISKLLDKIKGNKLLGNSSKFLVLPLHGSMPTVNQREIFDRPPSSMRKIVLATNIAESSITIDDVVYVIDCGKAKETSYDALNKLACLLPSWISKASAHQRRGRAGRVQPGVCFRLYPKMIHDAMPQYQLPEILRTPLQELCLHIKSLQLGAVSSFLAKALQPPDPLSVQNAIELLKTIGAIDDTEELTPLGRHLCTLPLDPNIGKMLLIGSIFQCLNPALTIASALAYRDPFVMPINRKEDADAAKRSFAGDSCSLYSDHIALLKAFDSWMDAKRNGRDRSFCWENFLSPVTLQMMENMRNQFLDLLSDIGFVNKSKGPKAYNQYSNDLEMICAILCAGLYPNVVQCKRRGKRTAFYTKEVGKVDIHPASVNAGIHLFPLPYLVYSEKVKTTSIYVRDSTNISDYVLLLFGGNLIPSRTGDGIEMLGGYLHFSASKSVLDLIKRLRGELDSLLERKISEPGLDISAESQGVVKAAVELLHSQNIRLSEVVDCVLCPMILMSSIEVLFGEPIVITACEFLEQNAPSSSPAVTLLGATSPPSFALEVFVQCEGESRFRRLCQPFLYSHSSSNVLEVEAVVTNHLVVRGSYRSLTLVVYGNTAEDLGQFNMDFDLDNSLASLVCSPAKGKLEDLPPALHSNKFSLEESISSLKSCVLVFNHDISFQLKRFLQLIFRIFSASNARDNVASIVNDVISAISAYVTSDLRCSASAWNQCAQVDVLECRKELQENLSVATNELHELYKVLQKESCDLSAEQMGEDLKSEAELASIAIELLPDLLNLSLFGKETPSKESTLVQNKSMILQLSVALVMCSGRESCFQFVSGGGMEQLLHAFHLHTQKSTAITLMFLGVIERATRYAIGCEGFLGWWPREDEHVPIGFSEGYSQILKLLLQKQRHEVASLATYVLHRLHSYEVASRYESAVLSFLEDLSDGGKVTNAGVDMLVNARFLLKKLLKLLNSCGPVEDPSPMAYASKSLNLGQDEGILSYQATVKLISSSSSCFSKCEVDPHLLSLLMVYFLASLFLRFSAWNGNIIAFLLAVQMSYQEEKGFLALSVALLSSKALRSGTGHTLKIFLDIVSSIEAILLSLLFCRPGLNFLLLQPEVTCALILSLRGPEDFNEEESVPLRYATILISKGFFCPPQDVGKIAELHLRVVSAIDRLLSSNPQSEELLWILWELCGISRSDSGRLALLALGHFPEAISVLMEALRTAKELEPAASNAGNSSLNLAIYHSAAELFEAFVTDSTAASLGSWIEHVVELHRALHSSSSGSNRKDAPTRLLEWIDAGVVYQKNGATGLLRYAAVASGGDALLTSASVSVSDSMDVENVVEDSATGSDIQVMDNLLGKLVSDKYFDGVTLRDSSVAQLTTAFRILAFISENSSVAAALYDEGALTLIYVVLLNCKFMLERSSNTYDYLVDEGAESNSTSDLLLERSREQSLVDLMIPTLVLLINLLQKLQDTKEQHRNTKLLNALLRLHREVSLKLAACAADLSSPYPGSALGLGTVCHLIVSALSCWPIFGWTPCLFNSLLDSVQATSSLALGPKEACSLLCLLFLSGAFSHNFLVLPYKADLLPEEGIWHWKSGMPPLSAMKTLAIGTLLGPHKERQVNWYLHPGHVETLLGRLTPLLEKFAQIVLRFAFTALVVIQDMLRVLVVRMALQKVDSAIELLRPIFSWIDEHVSETSNLSDIEVLKAYRLLEFLSSLLEHPCGKSLLLKEGAVNMLIKVLLKCSNASYSEAKCFAENRTSVKGGLSLLSWCLPVFKSFTLICDSQEHTTLNKTMPKLTIDECSVVLKHILKLCQSLPVGKELLFCLLALRGLASCKEGKDAFSSIFMEIKSASPEKLEVERGTEQEGNDTLVHSSDWGRHPALLYCWRNLMRGMNDMDELSTYAIDGLSSLSSSALDFCVDGGNINMEGVSVLRLLFRLPIDLNAGEHSSERLKDIHAVIDLLDIKIREDQQFASSYMRTGLLQVKEMVEALLMVLQSTSDLVKVADLKPRRFCLLSSDIPDASNALMSQLIPSITTRSAMKEDIISLFSQIGKSENGAEKSQDFSSLAGLSQKFMWECPDSLPDKLAMSVLPLKRKMASMEGPNRRSRDNSGAENVGSNALARGMGPPTASVPTRRDTFRQRKPNTSRPPSMHVDDYVARERNNDGTSGTPNASIQRGGSNSGRPPSIHVDEFMARQRDRQVPMASVAGEMAPPAKNVLAENDIGPEKIDKSRQLKADLDDDLQINIVFDGEESEPDDRLPFPQPDDNLQSASLVVEGRLPRSIVEETESNANGSTQISNRNSPLGSNADEVAPSELSSRRSVSRPERQLSREASVSSEKFFGTNTEKAFFHEQSDEMKHTGAVKTSIGFDSSTAPKVSAFRTPFYNKNSASSGELHGDSRMPQPVLYQRDGQQPTINIPQASGSQGLRDQKQALNQPPLPPFPPPPNILSGLSQNPENAQSHASSYGHSIRDMPPPLPSGFPSQPFDGSGPSTVPSTHVREDRASHPNFSSGLLPLTNASEIISDSFNSQLQTDYSSTFNNASSTPVASRPPRLDSKYSWTSLSAANRLQDVNSSLTGGTARPPPLPPMPPPFSASSMMQMSVKSSTSQSSGYNQASVGNHQLPLGSSSTVADARMGTLTASGGSLTSYSPPQLVSPLLMSRPASVPVSLFSGPSMQHQGQTTPSLLHSVSTTPSIHSAQPRVQLQPLQPPQPPHPPPHLRPPIEVSQQLELGLSLLQNPIQVQGHPFQMQQQPHLSPIPIYFQSQQPEPSAQSQQPHQVENVQSQSLLQQGDSASLQHYFSSPEAIQSLLSDREKLCQLLEQHPKLMQLLQDVTAFPFGAALAFCLPLSLPFGFLRYVGTTRPTIAASILWLGHVLLPSTRGSVNYLSEYN